ncbi:MAG: hypothetical protein J2P58_08210 [Acidimicrobiaceae bacterium]|nr:hypothetical protein [Acidimicrobiaceae bacterium]
MALTETRGGSDVAIRDETGDAFDTLIQQDGLVDQLLDAWREGTHRLEEGDDVVIRSRRGSDVKLLLQHLAVREASIDAIERRLTEKGEGGLAHGLQAQGVARREAIRRLDRLVRGRASMTVNNADVSLAVIDLGKILDRERAGRADLLAQIEAALGPREERRLPSARSVRTHSPTMPSTVPRWYDRIGPLKAGRALYDHLRGTPSHGTRPSVDAAREHTPGLRD